MTYSIWCVENVFDVDYQIWGGSGVGVHRSFFVGLDKSFRPPRRLNPLTRIVGGELAHGMFLLGEDLVGSGVRLTIPVHGAAIAEIR
jgi:hypothetical protein